MYDYYDYYYYYYYDDDIYPNNTQAACVRVASMHGDTVHVVLFRLSQDAKSGRTALHFAVDSTSPSLSVISTLLRQPQLRINAPNFAQQTALELARGRNHLDLVDLLHVHGAEWSNRIHGYYSSDSFSEDDMVMREIPVQSEMMTSDNDDDNGLNPMTIEMEKSYRFKSLKAGVAHTKKNRVLT